MITLKCLKLGNPSNSIGYALNCFGHALGAYNKIRYLIGLWVRIGLKISG